MTSVLFWVVSCLVIGTLFVVGAAVKVPAWSIGVGVFVLLFPFTMWLTYRDAKSAVESAQTPRDAESQD